MENALWNGKIILASDVAKTFDIEEQVRKASGRKELHCIDKDCKAPILKYCHGDDIIPYFAHLVNCECDYKKYDRDINEQASLRQIKQLLYNHFLNLMYDIQPDVKILPHHYTHFLITMPNNKKIALELGTQRLSARQLEALLEQYKEHNIAVKWIVISDSQDPASEADVFHLKRFLLNCSVRKDVVILNGINAVQYIEDTKQYEYMGNKVDLSEYGTIYSQKGLLCDLVFDDEEIALSGFYDNYQNWFNNKQRAFCVKKDEYEKARQTRIESTKGSISERLNQNDEEVWDKKGQRWLRCERCLRIGTVNDFCEYGSQGKINLGICKFCNKDNL